MTTELTDVQDAALPQGATDGAPGTKAKKKSPKGKQHTGKIDTKSKRHRAKVPLPPPGRMAVSLDEAAALTGLCVNSIRRAVKIGKLKVRHFGARVIVRRTDLDAFLTGLPEGLQTRPSAE